MKAVVTSDYGLDKLVVKEVDSPLPKEEQILIKVYAASINPFDVTILSGIYKDKMPLQFPYIPGGDFSGVVEQLGPNITEYKVGDELFGTAAIVSGGSGSMAQKALAKITSVAKKPEKIDFLESASLPLVGSSAVQALEEHMNLQKGQKILIHGGAGGIGSIAIQIAKYIGAFVATTVSDNDKDFVKNIGADKIIDYKNEHFQDLLTDFDAVYDTIGGKTQEDSFKVLKKGGILLSMKGKPSEDLAKQYGVNVIGQGTHTNTAHLARLAELVDKEIVKPKIDKVFTLAQVKEAFYYQTKNSPRGKVVLDISK